MDKVDEFCASIEQENLENLNSGEDNSKIKEIVKKIKQLKTYPGDKSEDCTKKKVIGCLYQQSINFLPNEMIPSDFPMSERFLQNLYMIHTNRRVIHHSHVTRKIIGYAHKYCNLQARENYFTIPVIAHNQFRFDFFLFLKGLRPRVWETTEINIVGENATDINFAIIQN